MTNLIRSNFQAHPFQLVSPSPWPLYSSLCNFGSLFALCLAIHIFVCIFAIAIMVLFTAIMCLSLAIVGTVTGTVIEVDLPDLPDITYLSVAVLLSTLFYMTSKIYSESRDINIVWKVDGHIWTILPPSETVITHYRAYAIYDTNDVNCRLLKLLYSNVEGMHFVRRSSRYNLETYTEEDASVLRLDHDRMYTGPFPYQSYFEHQPFEFYNGINGEVPASLRVKYPNPYVYALLIGLGFRITTCGIPIERVIGIPHLGVPAGIIVWSKLFCARP